MGRSRSQKPRKNRRLRRSESGERSLPHDHLGRGDEHFDWVLLPRPWGTNGKDVRAWGTSFGGLAQDGDRDGRRHG